MIQNITAGPTALPARPKASGMMLELALIAIERKAIASPWRLGGVRWCSVDMIIGWTAPSVSPSRQAQTPINQAVPANG